MATGSQTWTEELIEVGSTRLNVVTGGSGKPLLILHGELGYSGWLKYHETLAQNYKLHIPLLPGFGVTPRIDWIMNIRDLASWYLGVLDTSEQEDLNVVGFSLGGWLAFASRRCRFDVGPNGVEQVAVVVDHPLF